jgi:hypothetical protein
MRSNDRQVVIRRADKNDLEGIFSALTKCANEIPVRMDGTEREAHFIKLIRQGCFSGRSYVAVSDNAVVGFVLATHSLPQVGMSSITGLFCRSFADSGFSRK